MKFSPAVLVGILLCGVAGAAQQRPAADPGLDPKTLDAALAAKSQGAEAERLADRIRTAFGGRDALLRGATPKIDELNVAWALDLVEPLPPSAPAPRVARDTGNTSYPMVQVGTTGIYAGYDYRHDWGSGFHTYLHGRAIFPDSLRWLWRDYQRESHSE